jgi:hypothetical protein
MAKSIDELDQKAQLMKVTWRKASNYHSSLVTLFMETRKEFLAGVYDPDWTFAMWLAQRAGLSEDQCLKIFKSYAHAITGEDNDFVAR